MAQTLCLFVFFSTAYILSTVKAQYEKYSFQSFPPNDLMPLESAYGHALEMYASQDWKQTAKYLELSLRLHRLLKDSEAYCSQNCSAVGREYEENSTDTTLLIMGHIIMRAACMKRCKTNFLVFSKSYPKRETLGAFEQRMPYRYLQYVYYQMNELERAVSAAHTYLQRNPGDPLLSKSLNYYKSLFDMEEYLINHEEQPYETLFLKAVKQYNSGDFSSSARDMELATAEYFKTYNMCLLSCEGSYDVQEFKDFYPTIADFYFEVMKCKVKCEENLIPNVGGYFVEKFVATMYHYMQFAYYKWITVRRSKPETVPTLFPWNKFTPKGKRDPVYERCQKWLPLSSVGVEMNEMAKKSLKLDHDYATPPPAGILDETVDYIQDLEAKLKKALRPPPDLFSQYCASDDQMRFYTKFPSERVFKNFWDSIRSSGIPASQQVYWSKAKRICEGTSENTSPSPPHSMPLIDEFLYESSCWHERTGNC